MPTHLDGHEFHLPPPTTAVQRALGAETPPADARDALEIFDDGDGRLRLVRGGREVGWLERRAIGFRGFPDADTARAAASAAHSTLSRWIARQSRTAPVPARRRPLSCRHDGVSEWLTLGGVRVGRLRRFTASFTASFTTSDVALDDAAAITDVGFELFLPPRVTDGLRLRTACVVERTLAAPSFGRAPDRRVDRAPATAS
jgi:hypothetical protein